MGWKFKLSYTCNNLIHFLHTIWNSSSWFYMYCCYIDSALPGFWYLNYDHSLIMQYLSIFLRKFHLKSHVQFHFSLWLTRCLSTEIWDNSLINSIKEGVRFVGKERGQVRSCLLFLCRKYKWFVVQLSSKSIKVTTWLIPFIQTSKRST